MQKKEKIYITGHNGMVGSAIKRLLEHLGYSNLLTVSSKDLDLRDQTASEFFFRKHKPDYVILAAAKVGGINANMNYPANFLYDNLLIECNVIHQAYLSGVKKLIFLGSSCIYPKNCPQPMKEEYLMTGKFEPTNESYALAKVVGLKMTEAYKRQYGFNSVNLMPCNLYGPNDSFDLEHSHVLSALVKRFTDAKDTSAPDIILWGTGIARREFMHVDDAAKATLYMIENYHTTDIINIGWGTDVSIKELAEMIASKVGYEGKILWDNTKPDGMLKKCMDVSKMKTLGFQPSITLSEGIDQMIKIYSEIKKR